MDAPVHPSSPTSKETTVSTSATVAETSHAAIRPALASRVVTALKSFVRAWKNRRAFYRLGELSDAQLADIGLTRTDLKVAIELGTDPTSHLGLMVDARGRERNSRSL